jgi:uncharacterized protein (DUF2236 family)
LTVPDVSKNILIVESARIHGPDSITWRVHSDSLMFVAGVRALYLQALLPRAMWAVAQNSNFREDTWGRFMRTVDYVVATSFGTVEEAERAAARVRKVHSMLRATDPETGEQYRIDDPELLTWIHCAETESYLTVTRRSGLVISEAEADEYVAEQRQAARLIGLDPSDVPGSENELAQYFERIRPQLRCTPEARDAARFLLMPSLPRWMGPALAPYAGVSSLAFAAQPRWARRMYRIPTPYGTEAVTTAALRTMRNTVGRVPPVWIRPQVKTARQEIKRARRRSRTIRRLGAAA